MEAPCKRVLLLSGGSLVGQNVLATLAGRRRNLVLIATNSVPDAPLLDQFDAVHHLPPYADGAQAYDERLLAVIDRCTPDLVVPCRDEDAVHLGRIRDGRRLDEARCLCGWTEVALAMLDKLASKGLCDRLGLPYAATIPALASAAERDAFTRRFGFPIVAKPIRGFASRGVRLLFNEAQVTHWSARDDYLFQEYLGDRGRVAQIVDDEIAHGANLFRSFEASKISLQVRITRGGAVGAVFCSLHSMRLGFSEQVARCTAADAHTLAWRCGEAFAAAGWRGPLNVQCQRDVAGELRIYEFNGRFTGATAARALLGFDEVGETLNDWLDAQLPLPATPVAGGDSVMRIPVSTAPNVDLIDAFSKRGAWERPSPPAT